MNPKTLKKLSPGLRAFISLEGDRSVTAPRRAKRSPGGRTALVPYVRRISQKVTAFAERTLNHCNGGATLDAAIWLKDHLDRGGKLVVTIAGALSSFQVGVMLAELIRQKKVHLISATGANHEESFYRFVAHSHYAYIPRYTELTPKQEAELRDAGLRRITDTFLPEDESVRIMEPHLLAMWREAERRGERYFPHEYFRRLFQERLIKPDPQANPEDCWAYAAFRANIPIIVPGFEDSTMGNIFAGYAYQGRHKKKNHLTVDANVMKSGIEYFHLMYDWYLAESKRHPIAFLQLGGGIAADFPICVVPSIKHDLQLHGVRDWAGFIEIGSSPMSYGSYSGAGGKEKITWDKLSTASYYQIIQSDVTVAFPWIAAVLLGL